MTIMMNVKRLATVNHATPGRCALCDDDAIGWERSERRDTDADGLTLAWRYCATHESAAGAAIRALTLADLVALVPARQRARRARQRRSHAARVARHARTLGRRSASLAGASSATHTYALLGGMRGLEARALLALADALDAAYHDAEMAR